MIIPGLACFGLSLRSRRKINFPRARHARASQSGFPRELSGPGHTPVRGG